MSFCKRCNEYRYSTLTTECDCKPWEIFQADLSYKGDILGYEEPEVFYGRSPAIAAEHFFKKLFHRSGCEITSCVVKIDMELYDCEAEPTVDFSVRRRSNPTLRKSGDSKVDGQ